MRPALAEQRRKALASYTDLSRFVGHSAQLPAVAMSMEKRVAAARFDNLPSIAAAITRCRRSMPKGLPIPAPHGQDQGSSIRSKRESPHDSHRAENALESQAT
jgi:hypothetical protein